MKICILAPFFLIFGLAYLAHPAPVCAQGKDDFFKDLLDKAENEYRLFFKEPKETHEFWAAIDFEINVGKFELAGFFLQKLMEKEPKADVDKELLKIQEIKGWKPFLRLRDVKEWSSRHRDFNDDCKDNAERLLKRLMKIVEKSLSDPDRIKKYIKLLDAPTKKERDNAYAELVRSHEKALPFLLETIRTSPGTMMRQRVIDALVLMEKEMVAPLYEILKAVDEDDCKDTNLRLAVLEIFRRRADFGCVPYLWDMSASLKYPPEVRAKALELLSYLRETDALKLPSAKSVLVELAEKCYHHKLKVDVPGFRIWHWDGKILAEVPEYMPKRKAEVFFGERYAREALELDPGYKPAQSVLLNFILERTFDHDLDKYFFTPMPDDLQQIMLGLQPGFLIALLEKALDDNNVPVILPLVDILGKRGELRAAEPTQGNRAGGLVRALYYPDRRVQYAAANALLKMPYRASPSDAIRVVEVLRRFLAAEPYGRTLVSMCPVDQALATENTFKMGKFEHVDAHSETILKTFEKLRRSADYDVIFIHPSVKQTELPYVVSQLRADPDYGRTPLIVLAPKEKVELWRKLLAHQPNTWVELDSFLMIPDGLKKLADEKIDLTGGGYNPVVGGWRLSTEERQKFTNDSMTFLWKMAKGEIPGYDVRGAQDTVRATLRNPELAKLALQTAATNPDADTQNWLAKVFFDPAFEKEKLTAVTELRQHILKNTLRLEKHHIDNLRDAQKTAEGEIKMQLTLITANLRFSPQDAGRKLNAFMPPLR